MIHTCSAKLKRFWNTQGRYHLDGKGRDRQPKVRQQLNFEEQWNSEVVVDNEMSMMV